MRTQRILIYFNNKISIKEAIAINYIYMDAITEIVIPIEGAFETLKYLSSIPKYYVIVATNGPKPKNYLKFNV